MTGPVIINEQMLYECLSESWRNAWLSGVVRFCLLTGWTEFCRMFRNSRRRLGAHLGLQWTQRQNALCGRWRREQSEPGGTFSHRFTHCGLKLHLFRPHSPSYPSCDADLRIISLLTRTICVLRLARLLFQDISSKYWNSKFRFDGSIVRLICECYYSKLKLDRVNPKNKD